jgi:hypothetical protein
MKTHDEGLYSTLESLHGDAIAQVTALGCEKQLVLEALDRLSHCKHTTDDLIEYVFEPKSRSRLVLNKSRSTLAEKKSELELVKEKNSNNRRRAELEGYANFISAIIVDNMVDAKETEALEKIKRHYNISAVEHNQALSDLSLTTKMFEDMQRHAREHEEKVCEKLCRTCRQAQPDYMIMSCKHVCLCATCRPSHCPKCQQQVSEVRQIFRP